MATLKDRLMHAYNAFKGRDAPQTYDNIGYGSSISLDRPRLSRGKDRTLISAIYSRLAIDFASITIKHSKLDDNGHFLYEIQSGLNSCLSLSANLDQTGRAFRQDAALTMFDEGVVALVPVDTSIDPRNGNAFDILSLRVGKIVCWYPQHVKVSVYNENTGNREEITLPKKSVAIVENPLYTVMNEPNSTLQRLIRKISLLDTIDEKSSAGKLDMIIQLPYALKSELRIEQAERRRNNLQAQLEGSKLGIGYIDATEKIIQLNRPIENNLLAQITQLQQNLFSQLGLSEAVFNGTADEKQLLDYHNRTIEPILAAFVDEMNRKFLTKTARTQHQSIVYFRDPFRLVPVTEIATIADTFTRNAILSSNEIRGIIGYKPSEDPQADELRNKNLNQESNAEDSESSYNNEDPYWEE